jgi:SAM-dependent MidA family methyltransferase
LSGSTIATLADRLRERISRDGPITFHDWMQTALYDEREGYYCADRIRQGRAGDYRTAPETSSLFAATFARYFAKVFAELDSPANFTIVEAGAGSGEFAHGVLTNLRAKHFEVFSTVTYEIQEMGTASRTQCAARLAEFSDRVNFRSPIVSEGLVEKDAYPTDNPSAQIVFSNELIDAFPVHRVTMRAGKLRELCVGIEEDGFVWIDCDPKPTVDDYCRRSHLDLNEGQVAEINLEAESFVSQAAARIENGYLITVDYGAERTSLLNDPARRDGTLRAFRHHRMIDDPLSHPGQVDLTTSIDWTQMKEVGERATLKTIRFDRLDQFLLAEGALEELEDSAARLSDVEALRLRTTAREMIMPHGMAAAFQVLVQQKNVS